jgi:hypothetical protein
MAGAQWKWKATGLLAAMACLGASGDQARAAEYGPKVLESFGFVLFAIAALSVLIWSVVLVRKRLAERQAEEEKAARMLEAQMMSLLANRQTTVSPESPARPAASDAAAAGGPQAGATPPASLAASGGTATDSAQAVEAVLTKLRSGGLLVGLEGSLYLSDGQSEGKIIRLRDGKTAVVLPRLETAEFLARQIKRFDLCIVALGAEQVCVIIPLGAYIADHVAL